jgi:hypothetical protein
LESLRRQVPDPVLLLRLPAVARGGISMPTETEAFLKEMDGKLDVIISLILAERPIAVKDKIVLLANFSIGNKDISRILGISESHVKKEKSLAKKG